MKNRTTKIPFMITGHDCLGEILRRNKSRKEMTARAHRLGIGMPSTEAVIERAWTGADSGVVGGKANKSNP